MAITAIFSPGTGVLSELGDELDNTIITSRQATTSAPPNSCVLSMWRWLKISLFRPYRPELHYMRGPGPKSLEKYALRLGSRDRRKINQQELDL
jgi:hypothetical protein